MQVVVDGIADIEGLITGYFKWPSYAVRTIATLMIGVFSMLALQYLTAPSSEKKMKETKEVVKAGKIPPGFRKFQFQYLSAYLTIILADWLQGTNMYTLYKSYDVDISTLFLTGFLSSAVFGTFLGIYVDTWGRKLGCIIFCVLEIIINAMEHVPEFYTLLIGRVLGGITTSLLFTAFESWMVTEHRKRGFPEELLESTFAISAAGTGMTAILAGLVAQISADISGDIGPFQLAIFLTVVVLVLVCFWPENTGDSSGSEGESSIMQSIRVASKAIYRQPGMLCLGLSQAFFEGGMYSFVFMWVPSLMSCVGGMIPTGLLFACLMLAMTLGGTWSSTFFNFGGSATVLAFILQVLAIGSMAVPIIDFTFWPVLIAFLVFEATVGMFNAAGGMLRSKYFPDKIQSSVMSVFRVPLNALVVTGTTLAGQAGDDVEKLKFVFSVVVGMHSIALLLIVVLYVFFPPPKPEDLNDVVNEILLFSEETSTAVKEKKAAAPAMKSPKKMRARSRSASRSPKKKQ